MDITKAFPLLMKQEGYSMTNVQGDKGGLTKFGIAQSAHPGLDIARLTEAEAQTIYASEYWAPAKCSDLKTELQYIHFSMSVNMGVGGAARVLQSACNVLKDGIIGSGTLQAAEKISIQDYAIACVEKYKGIVEADGSQAKFLKGWENRIDQILQWYKQGFLN